MLLNNQRVYIYIYVNIWFSYFADVLKRRPFGHCINGVFPAFMKISNGDMTEDVGWDLTWDAPGRSSKLWQPSARPLRGFSLGLVPWSIPGKQAVSQCQSQITKNGLKSMQTSHVHPCSPSPKPRFSMGYWQNPSLSRYWWSLQWWPPTCWIQLGSPGAVDWNTVLANPAISGEKLGMVKLALPH